MVETTSGSESRVMNANDIELIQIIDKKVKYYEYGFQVYLVNGIECVILQCFYNKLMKKSGSEEVN